MVKHFGKKSKRQTCRQKFKVERKVAEHHRKIRKEQRKKVKSGVNPAGGARKRARDEVRVPNEAPFKEKVLAEAAAAKVATEERRAALREEARNQKRQGLAEVVDKAKKAGLEWEKKQSKMSAVDELLELHRKPVENSAKAFHKELEKVLSEANVILVVLDARDPIGSRCPEVEERIKSAGKRMILVLNKVDLIPIEIAHQWLTYLRRRAPTLAFKASTQKQSSKLGQAPEHLLLTKPGSVAQCLGAQSLLKLLGSMAQSMGHAGDRAAITVGVVGLPNVGKSSIINSLKRERACNVGATPGVTRVAQVVQLDKMVRLVDSPGVVLAGASSSTTPAQLILRNCVRAESVEDPEPAVEEILKRCEPQRMMLHYGIPAYTCAKDFLVKLARRGGMLRKGGLPDCLRAGRRLLNDWAQGRLTYYTMPPAETDQEANELAADAAKSHVGLVEEFSKEFDINNMDETVLKASKSMDSNDMVVSSLGTAKMAGEEDEEEEEDEAGMEEWTESEEDISEEEDSDEEMDTDGDGEEGSMKVVPSTELKNGKMDTSERAPIPKSLQRNRTRKLQQKRDKKQAKRLAKNTADDDDSDYDFEEHFPQ